jgi:transcriptional regulator with XRE-family HTH domain
MDTKTFWNRIKKLTKEKKVTQKDVAEGIGMPLGTLKTWMYKNTVPSLDYTIELSRYFGVSIQYLVFGKDAEISAVSAMIKEAQNSLKIINEQLKEIRREGK